MGMQIREVMTPTPQTVQAGSPASEAAKLMKDADAGMIPVVDDGRLVGTVTDRDIVLRVVAAGRDPQATTAGEIASTEIVTVEPDQDLDEALGLMARHQVRRLPVVEDGRLVGILAQADVARSADDGRVAETLEQISR